MRAGKNKKPQRLCNVPPRSVLLTGLKRQAENLCDWENRRYFFDAKHRHNFTGSDLDLMDQLQKQMVGRRRIFDFANFVEFDSLFENRRDPTGYPKH